MRPAKVSKSGVIGRTALSLS